MPLLNDKDGDANKIRYYVITNYEYVRGNIMWCTFILGRAVKILTFEILELLSRKISN